MNSSGPIIRDQAENLTLGALTTHHHWSQQIKKGLYSFVYGKVQERTHFIRNFLMDSNKQVMIGKTYYGLILLCLPHV